MVRTYQSTWTPGCGQLQATIELARIDQPQQEIYKTGRRTLATINEFEVNSPKKKTPIPTIPKSEPLNIQAHVNKEAIKSDYFWNYRDKGHVRINSTQSAISDHSQLSDRFVRVKLITEPVDDRKLEKQRAALEWKKAIETQINEKRQREAKELQKEREQDELMIAKRNQQQIQETVVGVGRKNTKFHNAETNPPPEFIKPALESVYNVTIEKKSRIPIRKPAIAISQQIKEEEKNPAAKSQVIPETLAIGKPELQHASIQTNSHSRPSRQPKKTNNPVNTIKQDAPIQIQPELPPKIKKPKQPPEPQETTNSVLIESAKELAEAFKEYSDSSLIKYEFHRDPTNPKIDLKPFAKPHQRIVHNQTSKMQELTRSESMKQLLEIQQLLNEI